MGSRHPAHCLSHHSLDGGWARCYVQEPEHECHSQTCVTACYVYVLVSARGSQPKLDVMIDLTVTHCIAYDAQSSNITYGVPMYEPLVSPQAGVGQKAFERSHHQQCNSMHQRCTQYVRSQLLDKCPSSLKQEHRKPNSAVAQLLAAATGNLFARCFSSVEQKQNQRRPSCALKCSMLFISNRI